MKYIKKFVEFVKLFETEIKEPIVKPQPITKPKPFSPTKPNIIPSPKNIKNLIYKLYLRYNKISTIKENISQNDMNQLMKDFNTIQNLENKLDKENLYQLAKDVIKYNFFDEKGLNINFDSIQWDLDISNNVTKSKKQIYPKISNIEDKYKKDIDKRNNINKLTQGFAKKSYEYLYNFENENSIDGYGIDKNLYYSWISFMRLALKTHDLPLEILSQQPATGSMHIQWIDDEPVIVCKAINFIILLHEMIKGIFELISFHGLSNDSKTQKYVDDSTSSWQNELVDFKDGDLYVDKFVNFFNNIENDLLKEGNITKKDKTMIMILLTNFYTLDNDKFLKYYDSIFNTKNINNEIKDYFKAIYLNNIENNINNEDDFDNIDYSKLSKYQIQELIDKYLDSGEYEKLKILKNYIKENIKSN